jgi:hypothetical protein
MSTFYLLPARPQLGERIASFLETLFPGQQWDSAAWSGLADLWSQALASKPNVYLVFGEELPDGPEEDRSEALVTAFGATAGDEIIQIRVGTNAAEFTTQRWRLNSPAGAAA